MILRLLQYFLAVCREENITRAAEMLHVTQPTLSRQMAQLEEELGATLFIRGRRLTLTEAGMKLRSRAEEIVRMMDRIETEFQEEEELAGTVSIGAGGLSSFQSLPPVIEEFLKKYPRVRFDFHTNNADFIKEQLDRSLLDFGLLLEPVDIAKYDYIRMREKERWGLLMRQDNPLARKAFITRRDLRKVPLITSNRLAIQQEVSQWLGNVLEELDIIATYNIITNVSSLVDSGLACALTLEGAVSLFEGGRLTFRPLSPALEMNSVLVWKKFNPFFNTAGKFLEFFQSQYGNALNLE